MTPEEFLALDAPEAAEILNKLVADGKSKDEAMAEEGVSQADLMGQGQVHRPRLGWLHLHEAHRQ